MTKINLNDLASELALSEGLGEQQKIGQIKEILALLGIRWRAMSSENALQEFHCIVERSGLLSSHNKYPDPK